MCLCFGETAAVYEAGHKIVSQSEQLITGCQIMAFQLHNEGPHLVQLEKLAISRNACNLLDLGVSLLLGQHCGTMKQLLRRHNTL